MKNPAESMPSAYPRPPFRGAFGEIKIGRSLIYCFWSQPNHIILERCFQDAAKEIYFFLTIWPCHQFQGEKQLD